MITAGAGHRISLARGIGRNFAAAIAAAQTCVIGSSVSPRRPGGIAAGCDSSSPGRPARARPDTEQGRRIRRHPVHPGPTRKPRARVLIGPGTLGPGCSSSPTSTTALLEDRRPCRSHPRGWQQPVRRDLVQQSALILLDSLSPTSWQISPTRSARCGATTPTCSSRD